MEDVEDSNAAVLDHCVEAAAIKALLKQLPNVDPRVLGTDIPGMERHRSELSLNSILITCIIIIIVASTTIY